MVMRFSEIRKGSESDVRAWLGQRSEVSRETLGVLALMLGDAGGDRAKKIAEELSVRVTGPGYV